MVENFALEKHQKNYFEIIHEMPLPTIFRTIGTIFGRPDKSRKLKPMRYLIGDGYRKQVRLRKCFKKILV